MFRKQLFSSENLVLIRGILFCFVCFFSFVPLNPGVYLGFLYWCCAYNYRLRINLQSVKIFILLFYNFYCKGQHELTSKSSLEELLEKSKEQGKVYLVEPFHQKDFHHYFNCQTWQE